MTPPPGPDAGTFPGGDEGRPVLIPGGAGFIGTNLADRLAATGRSVLILDNLSRRGVECNLAWLRETHGERIAVMAADIRDFDAVSKAVLQAGQIFHFAAQVAVTTSLADPIDDFAVNAGGTLNVLEAIRASSRRPPLVFTSTNKVYGAICAARVADASWHRREAAARFPQSLWLLERRRRSIRD
jgi:CDP-paratose 2-epimerase